MKRGLLAQLAQRSSDELVAFGAAGTRTLGELWRDAAYVAAALPSAAPGAEVLLVIRRDRYALAVALLASWTRGYVPVLPPELDRDAITSLAAAASTVSVLHDTASGIALALGPLLAEAGERAPAEAPRDLASLACPCRGYVRDQAGQLQPAVWGEDWLDQAAHVSELLALRRGQRCATGIAPTHPHGVALGVLTPLLAGAAFLREPLAPGVLGDQLAALEVEVLLAAPAHWNALLEAPAAQRTSLRRALNTLVGLTTELAGRAKVALGFALEDVSAGRTQVPLLACGAEAQHEAAALTPADLALLRRLEELPGVRDVAAVRVTAPAHAALCVALVGDEAALAAAREVTVDRPAPTVEMALLRAIRRDAIGRFQRGELLRQFRRRADGTPIRFELTWGEARAQHTEASTEHSISVRIPADYPYFDGHFPGYPILPGAAQLSELVLPFVRRVRPDLTRLTQMSRLKFSGRIQPGETIDVVISLRGGATVLDFALRRGNTLCSAGTLGFAGEGVA